MKNLISKKVLFGLLILMFFSEPEIYSQDTCHVNLLQIKTQSWVDSFQINFPGCKVLLEPLKFFRYEIEKLDSLYTLEHIGFLSINDTKIRNLKGLHNLKSAYTLNFSVDSLEDLSQLNKLEKVGTISIVSNDKIKSLAGLSIDSILGRINIYNLSVLNSFIGLRSKFIQSMLFYNNPLVLKLGDIVVDSVYSIETRHNQTFEGISVLNPELVHLNSTNVEDISEINLVTNLKRLVLSNNPKLKECAIPVVCQNIERIGFLTVSNNGSGCNSIEEIKAACVLSTSTNTSPVLNVIPNPVWDEVTISWQEWILPDSKILITNAQGREIHHYHVLQGQSQVRFSVLNWPAGIYFYTVQSPSSTKLAKGKFVKM